MYRAALRSRATICHFHDPELIWVGILLKLRGRKVIYDVHEDLPRQILAKEWISAPVRRPIALVASVVERVAGWVFDGIVVVTPSIAARFPASKTALVRNFPILSEFRSVAEGVPFEQRPALAVYVGGVESARGADVMVDAVGRVDPALGVRLVLAGRAEPEGLLATLASIPGWDRCSTPGWLERDAIQELLGEAQVGLAVLAPTPSYVDSSPTKIFEYLAAGLPVVASDFPAWRELIVDGGCGVVVDPLDPDAVARAIEGLLRDPDGAAEMGLRGRALALSAYSWETEREALMGLYGRVLRTCTPDLSL